jgi:hypothetical protein
VRAQMPNDAAAEKAGSAEHGDGPIGRCHHDSIRQFMWNRTVLRIRWPPTTSYCFFAGAPGRTAATPSGLMLKAKNINGSLPGFPHWCTRAYGS